MGRNKTITTIKKAQKLSNTAPFKSLADLTEEEVQELYKDLSPINITLNTESLIFIISRVGLSLEFRLETSILTHISLNGCGEFITILPTQTGWNFKLNITKKTQIDLYENKLKYKHSTKKRHLQHLICRLCYENGEIHKDSNATLSYNIHGREINTYKKRNKQRKATHLNDELTRLTLPVPMDRQEFKAKLNEERDDSNNRDKKRKHFNKKEAEYIAMAISQLRIIAQTHKLA